MLVLPPSLDPVAGWRVVVPSPAMILGACKPRGKSVLVMGPRPIREGEADRGTFCLLGSVGEQSWGEEVYV